MTVTTERLSSAQQIRRLFVERFDVQPCVFRAPGRINVIGEHTDYNQGLVMPAAIDLAAWAAAAPTKDRRVVVYSANLDETAEIDLDRIRASKRGGWIDYVHGVALGLEQRGVRIPGARMAIRSDVPIGAGLSSSAALEVVSALALAHMADAQLDPTELALLCQAAENDFVGARCGVMDQFVSTKGRDGHALTLDCRDLSFRLTPLPVGLRFVVANTMVQHDLTAGKYNRRRSECEQALERLRRRDSGVRSLRDVTLEQLDDAKDLLSRTQYRRVRHVVSENARVGAAEAAIAAGDGARLGELITASHKSLRDDYEVSCRELDVMAELAQRASGVLGARMMGGGFGGSVLVLTEAATANDFAEKVASEYAERTGLEPWFHVCSIQGGAALVEPCGAS